jgi:SAM-dependent methyltransferase
MNNIRSISHRKTNDTVLDLVARHDLAKLAIIDVGAGEGFFCQKLGEYIEQTYHVPPGNILHACDLFPAQFKYEAIRCDPANINEPLPYADATFDIACSIEVIEHLENQFAYLRELYRICRKGGRVLITTPNILNINSRVHFFYAGFWSLFRPLPLASSDPVHASGHINPVTFYYLAYQLTKAGFQEVQFHYDRLKKSGLILTLLFYPLIALLNFIYLTHLRRKAPALHAENAALLAPINTLKMLASR